MKFNELHWALTRYQDSNKFTEKMYRRVDAFAQLLRSSHATQENFVYNIALAIWRIEHASENLAKKVFESVTEIEMTKFIVNHVALKNLNTKTKHMLNRCKAINENDAYRRLTGQQLS